MLQIFRNDLDEIDVDSEISLVEQEICFLSDFFLYSSLSSWSTNVNLERAIAGRADSLLNTAFEIKEEKEEKNCDLEARIGNKNEFGVFPFVSFPGSGYT